MLRKASIGAVRSFRPVLARSFAGTAEKVSKPKAAEKADAKKYDPEQIRKEFLKEATGVIGNAHRSNAEELIDKVPVIKVKGTIAVCDGGGGSLGHPVEYIQLALKKDQPSVCKYCGLRYEQDHGDHHHH